MKLSRWQRIERERENPPAPPLLCMRCYASAPLGGYTNIFVAQCVRGELVLRFSAELQLLLNHFVNPSSENPTEEERHFSLSCGSNTKGLLFFFFFLPPNTQPELEGVRLLGK